MKIRDLILRLSKKAVFRHCELRETKQETIRKVLIKKWVASDCALADDGETFFLDTLFPETGKLVSHVVGNLPDEKKCGAVQKVHFHHLNAVKQSGVRAWIASLRSQ
jgi:hypothetical protein